MEKNTGIFVRSAQLDALLNRVPTDELLGKDEPNPISKCNNFFGQLPEAKNLPLTTENMHKAKPEKFDHEKLKPYFAHHPVEVIRHTLRRTTQLAKSIIRFPMRKDFKSRFQMLRKKRLNEIVSTDTYFSSVKSLEGHWCAQCFHGNASTGATRSIARD